jgi:hypothetical protein
VPLAVTLLVASGPEAGHQGQHGGSEALVHPVEHAHGWLPGPVAGPFDQHGEIGKPSATKRRKSGKVKPNRLIRCTRSYPCSSTRTDGRRWAWLSAAIGFAERTRIGDSHRAQLSIGKEPQRTVKHLLPPVMVGRAHAPAPCCPPAARHQARAAAEDRVTRIEGKLIAAELGADRELTPRRNVSDQLAQLPLDSFGRTFGTVPGITLLGRDHLEGNIRAACSHYAVSSAGPRSRVG